CHSQQVVRLRCRCAVGRVHRRRAFARSVSFAPPTRGRVTGGLGRCMSAASSLVNRLSRAARLSEVPGCLRRRQLKGRKAVGIGPPNTVGRRRFSSRSIPRPGRRVLAPRPPVRWSGRGATYPRGGPDFRTGDRANGTASAQIYSKVLALFPLFSRIAARSL